MFTVLFWKQAAERAAKSAAAGAVVVLTASGVTVDWVNLGKGAGIAALVSVLTSIVSAAPFMPGQTGDPSLITPEPPA